MHELELRYQELVRRGVPCILHAALRMPVCQRMSLYTDAQVSTSGAATMEMCSLGVSPIQWWRTPEAKLSTYPASHVSHGELHVCTCHVQICEELKEEPCDAKGEGWGDSVDPVLWVLPGDRGRIWSSVKD